MFLSRFAIKRPLMVFMIFVGVIVLGLISLQNLKVDLFPEMDFPMVVVVTSYSGVGPQEIESMVTEPLEKILATVTAVKNVSSKSLQEMSVVMLEFEWGTDMSAAAQDMREKIDLVSKYLPDGVDKPMIIKFDPSMMPIMFMGVSGKNQGLDELRTVAEDTIGKRVERIEGVAMSTVTGGLQREIQVHINRNALEGRGLSIQQVMSMLAAANLNSPGGHIKTGDKDYIVRVIGQFKTVEDIGQTVIGNQRGVPIRLRDIAEVKDDFQETTSVVRINGKAGVLLQIQKESSANTVELAGKVRKELEKLRPDLPPGVEVVKIMDQSEFIGSSINNVKNAAVEGAILAVFFILLFLGNWRSTFIISLAIPISVIATFALLYFGKLTLNMATMGGLALGIGRLVDDAIVVLENIYRHMQAGERPREASLLGAIEVGNAVIAATITTIIVFVPIFFTTGLAGVIFKPMAYTVSFSLLASFFVALMLIPVLTSKFLKVEDPKQVAAKQGWLARFIARFNYYYEQFADWYQSVLNWVLVHRRRVIWTTVIAGVLSLVLVPFTGMEFIPNSDSGEFNIKLRLPIGSRLERSVEVLDRMETIIQKEVPEAESVLARVGIENQGMGAMASIFGGISGPHAGIIQIRLVKRKDRGRTTEQVVEALRPKLEGIPGAEIRFEMQSSMNMGSNAPIQVEIRGHDLVAGKELAERVRTMMNKVKGVRDVEISREEGLPELQVVINRQRSAELGLSIAQIGGVVETAMAGKITAIYRDPLKGKEYNVLLQYQDVDRKNLADLDRLFVVSPQGVRVPLGNVAQVISAEGPTVIDHKNQERLITVSAQVAGRAPGDVASEVSRKIRSEITVPDEFNVEVTGTFKDMTDAFKNLLFALALAMLLVYMVMVAQFESLLDPFIIMFTVPLGVVGVIWGLFLTGNTLSVVSFLGIIMMAGIVVSNGILLVDYTTILRRRGKTLREAVVEAGRTRLRPILMTSLTTIAGMLPMALGLGEGGEFEAPMAVSVIFGLGLSTLLTLVIIPTLYTIIEEKFKRKLVE